MKRLLLVLWSAVLVGCGGDSQQPQQSPPLPDVTGNWHFTAASSVNSSVIHLDGSILDLQNQNHNILANLGEDVPDPACIGTGGVGGNIVGAVLNGNQSGQSVPLAGGPSQSGADITMSLTSASDGNTINGTYSVSGGCSDNGTVSGVRVPSLSGSWSGTVDGGPTTFSASLSQDSPSLSTINGNITVGLSGAVQFSASSCFASGPLTANSGVWGNTVELDIAMADGLIVYGSGQVSDPSTAKTMTFSYTISSPTGSGPCDGQTGTFTMNR